MLTLHDARNALDRLIFEDVPDDERRRIGQLLGDYIDHVGSENETLAVAHRHEISKRDRYFANASQKEMELRTLRSVAELEALLSDSKVKQD